MAGPGEHELAAEAASAFSLLPDALLLHITCSCDEVHAHPFSLSMPPPPRLPPSPSSQLLQATVLRMGAVCRRWRVFVRDPAVWRALCLAAWPGDDAAMSHAANHWGGWKCMLFTRPRLMTDGVYVQ